MSVKHDLDQLFATRVRIDPNGCWTWTGARWPESNYGNVYTRPGGKGRARVHRVAYERANGPIPNGMTVEHRCHTLDKTCAGGPTCMHRLCVNPEHLELLTADENARRQRYAKRGWTHCSRGHEFTPDNTKIRGGRRACRTCDDGRTKAYRLGVPIDAVLGGRL
jgi:hypothetical protein